MKHVDNCDCLIFKNTFDKDRRFLLFECVKLVVTLITSYC